MVKILYLCRKYYYDSKMSRVRFHAMKAIEKVCDVTWSGPGWENWDAIKNFKGNYDLIFVYKPAEIPGISEVSIPKCVSYNEIKTPNTPVSATVEEIMKYKIDLVICHHKNEMDYPEFRDLPCTFVNIPHCAEKTIFKDYQLPKTVDVLLVGRLYTEWYPLRSRFAKIIKNMREDKRTHHYKLGILKHPGYRVEDADSNREAISYAKQINAAKICLTCSGEYHYRYAKYAEIPACRSLLMADLPREDQDFFKEFMAVVDPEESDEAIIEKIVYYLENDEEREKLTDLGYALTHENYTQKHYAQRFLEVVDKFLKI